MRCARHPAAPAIPLNCFLRGAHGVAGGGFYLPTRLLLEAGRRGANWC
jgi:hypothetical protein